jgi:hypothetical protein
MVPSLKTEVKTEGYNFLGLTSRGIWVADRSSVGCPDAFDLGSGLANRIASSLMACSITVLFAGSWTSHLFETAARCL